MRHFCTFFDKNYLSRGLVLYDSLRLHHAAMRLYVGCLDEATHRHLIALDLPDLVPIPLDELERYDRELAATRATRSRVEYYFTSTPAWIRHVLARHADVDLITYIDSDYRLFASSEPLQDELGAGSIAAVEHRFPAGFGHLEDRGRFNVGWLMFRRDEQGLACVDWWRERCIEWCYDRVEVGRYADQKYLDEWPARYPGFVVLRHKGVSVAPWNVGGVQVAERGGRVFVDEQPLICFHYHGMKHVIGPLYASGLLGMRVPLDRELRRLIYEPYLRELLAHGRQLARAGLTDGAARSARYVDGRATVRQRLGRAADLGALLLSRTFLVAPLGASWR